MRGRVPLAEAAEAEALWEPWANAALFRWILATSAVQFLSGGGRLSFTCVERAAARGSRHCSAGNMHEGDSHPGAIMVIHTALM